MRALTYAAFGATPVVVHPPRPDPAAGRRGGAGAGQRAVPQRLARLDGPRRRHHDVPARAGPRAGRGRRGGGRRRGCRVAGSRGHRAVRHGVRRVPGVPGRRRPGLPEPAAAGVHRPGLVRRARRRARRRDQPRRPARRARRRGGGRAGLPGGDGLPRGGRAGRPCARATRCWSSAAAGSGSRRSRSPAAAGRSSAPSTSPRPRSTGPSSTAPTRWSTPRSGPDKVLAAVGAVVGGRGVGEHRRPGVAARRAAPASSRSAGAGGTCRWGCCRRPPGGPTCRWSG